MVFDGDHDFEGPRSPRAHLDTVLRNLSSHTGRPFTRNYVYYGYITSWCSPLRVNTTALRQEPPACHAENRLAPTRLPPPRPNGYCASPPGSSRLGSAGVREGYRNSPPGCWAVTEAFTPWPHQNMCCLPRAVCPARLLFCRSGLLRTTPDERAHRHPFSQFHLCIQYHCFHRYCVSQRTAHAGWRQQLSSLIPNSRVEGAGGGP